MPVRWSYPLEEDAMQRDYYDPLSRDRGLAENQDPSAGTPPPRSSEPYDPEQEGMGERARHATEEARHKAEEMGQQARERAQHTAEQGKDATASGLDTAAEQIRERVGQGDGTAAQAGTKVADNLERTAGYLREHETGEMWQDLERYVRDHPVQAAAGALVAGFFVGRMLR
jgi:ElaB/YqjD/DUF883 family membrane-anchored ribosome-binding protein